MPEYEADASELVAAGWGNYPRHNIPQDWRTRRPPATRYERPLSCLCGKCETCKARKKYREKALFRKTLRPGKKALDNVA